MDTTLKAKWIEALRSGDYKQVDEALMLVEGDTKSYCCLGVLCAISDEVEEVPHFSFSSHGAPYVWGEGKDAEFFVDGELGPHFAKHIGIDQDLQAELIHLNDSGETFADIANVIEEKL